MTVADPILETLTLLLAGQYVLERELGRGGMGVVYLARDERLDRLVAIKVLPPHLAQQSALRERFVREARTAAQLSHPNIVPVYRADEIGGYAFFAMAFVEGESLADRVRDRGPLPPGEAVRVLRETAWALAYAHARGVIHRDIKPANIMLERGTGRVVVTDFGIARDARTSSLTEAGEVLGSVHFVSPEQVNGESVDGRSDLYALGVVGFYLLSGVLPFDAPTPAAVLVMQATRPAPPLASVAPELPRALTEVIDRCLAKQPEARYATGEALAEALAVAVQNSATGSRLTEPGRIVSQDEARAIWLRAAQLQAEAATRLENRSREASGLGDLTSPLPTGGYRLADVEAAAQEVGIAPEFVALALAEQPAPSQPPARIAGAWEERASTALLGTSERSVSVSRVIRASSKAVLQAIGRVCTAQPYVMTLRDTIGGHPLDGGVMVFDIPKITTMAGAGLHAYTPFTYRMAQIELRQVNFTLRPHHTGPVSCEVVLYGDLRPGLAKNLKADGWFSAGGGVLGAAVGATGLAYSLGMMGALAALPAVRGALAVGGLTAAWYRWLYRRALRKSTEALEEMLATLEQDLRSQQVFGVAPTRSSPPKMPGGGSLDLIGMGS